MSDCCEGDNEIDNDKMVVEGGIGDSGAAGEDIIPIQILIESYLSDSLQCFATLQ